MSNLRRLARELVIFGLIAGSVGGIVGIVMEYRELHPSVLFDMSKAQPIVTPQDSYDILACIAGATSCPPALKSEIELCIGSTASTDPICEQIRKASKLPPSDPLEALGTRATPVTIDPSAVISLADAAPQPSIWDNTGVYLLAMGFASLIGTLVGFGLWIFYRMVRFAVKG